MAGRIRLHATVLSLIACFASTALGGDEPLRLPVAPKDIDRALGTQWFGFYLLGKKVGFGKFVLERVPDVDPPSIRASLEWTGKITALGQKLEMRFVQTEEFEGRAPYRLIRATSLQSDGDEKQEVELRKTESGFEAVVVTGDDRQIRKLGDFDYAIADWLTEELWIQSRPKAGARVVTRSLDLDKLRITTERTELTGTETTVVDGVVMTVFNVKTEIPEDRITITGTVDQNGQLLSMQMPGFVELRREPENLAKDITFSADLFWHSVVRVDKPLGDPQKVVALEVELLGGKDWGISSGPCQAVDRDPSGNKITLRLGRKYGKPVRATEEEIRENLAESVLYPIAHPRVKETAQKATANAKTPREKVEQLIAFVGELVEDDYFAEPLTVLDILNRKRGDCSEHALLFTTLARSVGIPAREVSGLVSMGEESNALGGHQWCEVVLEGSWVPVDPTFEELDINATHISFGAHAGEQIQLMSKLKGTSLKVLKVVTAEGNP